MAKFEVQHPNKTIQQFEITRETLILVGREVDNALILTDPRVSRKQFQIDARGGQYVLINLSSTQATKINGRPVDRAALRTDDVIDVGATRLIFHDESSDTIHESSARTPPPVPSADTLVRSAANIGSKSDVTLGAVRMAKQELKQAVQFSNDAGRMEAKPLATFDPEKTSIQNAFASAMKDSVSDTLRKRLMMLHEISQEMVGQLQLGQLLEFILTKIFDTLKADNGLILLVDLESRQLVPNAIRLKDDGKKNKLRVSQTLIRRVFQKRIGILIADTLNDENLSGQQSIMGFGIRSVMCVPLMFKSEVLGVIHVDTETTDKMFNAQDLEMLTLLANQAALCVHNARLTDQIVMEATQRANLERFLSPVIAEKVASKEISLEPGAGKSLEVAILFSDIRGFTTLSERLDPGELILFLSQYFSAMLDTVFEFHGTFDKFYGDALIAVFGCPVPDPHAELNAARCAEKMIERLEKMNFHVGPISIGIGLHRGRVVFGNIGGEAVVQLTVIGDTVNTASRLSDIATANQIVLSQEILDKIKSEVETRALGAVHLKGKSEPMETFELTRCL